MKLETQAIALFEIKDASKIAGIMWALDLRETCSRCGGSGHYSYNQIDGSRCFGCAGRGMRAAKLTRKTLAEAKAKVEAGELAAARARGAERKAARKACEPALAAAREAYELIGAAYTTARSRSATRSNTTLSTCPTTARSRASARR